MTVPMNELTELLESLRQAEITYKTCKSSLDNSTALITAKQELKEARYDWLTACEEFVLNNPLIKDKENV
jgi:hypothetical protein